MCVSVSAPRYLYKRANDWNITIMERQKKKRDKMRLISSYENGYMGFFETLVVFRLPSS